MFNNINLFLVNIFEFYSGYDIYFVPQGGSFVFVKKIFFQFGILMRFEDSKRMKIFSFVYVFFKFLPMCLDI